MGQGIARVVAATGTDVILVDKDLNLANKAYKEISDKLDKESPPDQVARAPICSAAVSLYHHSW